MIKFHFNKKFPNITKITLNEGKEVDVWMKDGGERTLAIGIGPRKDMTRRKLILLFRQIIVIAKGHKIANLELEVKDFRFEHLPITPAEFGELMAVSFEMANYEFFIYKTGKDKKTSVTDVSIQGAGEGIETGSKKGQIIGFEINASRSLSNTPGGEMTPKKLASEIKKAIGKLPIKLEVLGKKQMQKLGMGAILGVASGSSEEPQFVIMEYRGGPKTDAPIVLVGKGITFDSGGLNIKPGDYMNDMHLDMSGGAAVAHSLIAAAKLKLKKNVIVLIPVVENMPSGSSYRPGDVLKSLSGQTIEIGNTDAEGRVILADALTYAHRYKAKLVVDVATLTGAAQVAVGQRASAIFSTEEKLLKQFQTLGEESGDYVWPLPLWDEFDEEIKGNFGDWSNVGKTRWGGAIHGAVFLKQFIKDHNWVHIDMAPRMLSIEGEYLAKGSAGAPIRLLVKILEEL